MNEQEKQATLIALRLLAATPKSKKRLKQKLEEKGFSGEVTDGVLGKLEKQGVLNDKNLAAAVFQTYSSYRPSGRRRIAFEMEKRGITHGLVEEVLQRDTPEEERGRALALARLRFENWKKLHPAKRQKKLYDYLIRRGFDYAVAREVIEEVKKLE